MRWTCRWRMWRIRHVKLWDIDWYLLIWTQNDIEVVLWDNWINCLFVAQISQTLIKRKCLQQKCQYFAFPVVFLIDSGYENGDRQCLQWLLPISRFDTGGANAKGLNEDVMFVDKLQTPHCATTCRFCKRTLNFSSWEGLRFMEKSAP